MRNLFILAPMVALSPSLLADEVKSRIGAEFDIGYFNTSGNGVTDSKANSGFTQQKMDVFFHFEQEKVKAMVQVDLNNLGITTTSSVSTDDSGNTSVASSSTAKALDDAWVQYSFSETFNLKWGYEWAFNNYYGLHSWFYFGPHLDLAHGTPKLEVNGKVAGVTYGLQLWEDESADQTVDDKDSGLFSNYAAKVQYNVEGVEAGIIYHMDGGYDIKDASGNTVKAEDATGYQVYAKYTHKSAAHAWLRMTQRQITSEQEGGADTSIGLGYTGIDRVGIYLANHTVETIVAKNGESKSGTSLDFKVDYAMNKNLKYFIQHINYSKDFSGAAEAFSTTALGLQARY